MVRVTFSFTTRYSHHVNKIGNNSRIRKKVQQSTKPSWYKQLLIVKLQLFNCNLAKTIGDDKHMEAPHKT